MGRAYNHWSEAEVAALKEGVARFGVGNWQKVVNDYAVLQHRTGVQLKDKVGAAGGGCRLWVAQGCLPPVLLPLLPLLFLLCWATRRAGGAAAAQKAAPHKTPARNTSQLGA
jgi:hypothetical protein